MHIVCRKVRFNTEEDVGLASTHVEDFLLTIQICPKYAQMTQAIPFVLALVYKLQQRIRVPLLRLHHLAVAIEFPMSLR